MSVEYEASKFIFDTKTNTYVCPQGKHLRYDAKQESHGAMRYRYKASKQDCDTCPALVLGFGPTKSMPRFAISAMLLLLM